jgi:Transposase IS4
MNAALQLKTKLKSAKTMITVGEFHVWLGLFLAAATKQDCGRDLWHKTSKRLRLSHFSPREGPDFGRFMTCHRFEDIKKVVLEAFSDHSKSAVDPWCFIRPMIKAFNDNRKRTVVDTDFVVVDESMSAFKPRRSTAGKCECHPKGLDHLSFIERKPGIIPRILRKITRTFTLATNTKCTNIYFCNKY